jgi:hypothetical protein
MALIQTRRGFLSGIAAAGATGLLRASGAEAADGPSKRRPFAFRCLVSASSRLYT